MALQLPVLVLGFGSVYREFFNAIAATVGSRDYGDLIKIMLLLGSCWTLVLASIQQKHALSIRWIAMYVVLMSVILMPNATVIIQDRTSAKVYSVSQVPLGLALLASVTSRIGTGFTELIESVFHTPHDFDYTHSGMLMGSKIISAASHFQVVGADFQRNLQGFVHQCVFYDVLLHQYSLQNLVNTSHLWNFVVDHASPARAFVYNGKVVTCQQGAKHLSHDWKEALQNSTDAYANLLFGDEPNAKAQLLSYFPESFQYLANISDGAAALMQQSMMLQAIQDGIGEWSSGLNAETALEDFAFAKAQQQKRIGYHILYRLAVYWLPLSKTVMELILFGSFLIIVLFLFFPFGGSVVKNYVMTLVWLELWPPLFAFENFILTFYGSHFLSRATLLPDGTHGLTLSTYSALQQMNADLGTLAGFFAALTPLLAIGLFKGMMSVFSQAANYIGGAIQTFAFAAAGEAVTGNLSLGNTQFDNHSAYNTSAYQYMKNPQVASGMMSYQLIGGGSAAIAPNGERILNSHSAVSQLPVTPHLAESLQNSFSQMSDRAETQAFREMHSAQTSYSSALRDLYDLGSTQSHTEASGTTSSMSSSGSFSSAAREVHQLVNRFAKEHHYSRNEAGNLLGALYASANMHGSIDSKRDLFGKVAGWMFGANIGGGASIGIKGEGTISRGHNQSAAINQAESFMQEHHFGETVEEAVRAVRENNFRTGSEDSNRLAENFASTYEQGNRFAKDASQSWDQSQSARQQASLVEQHSVSINAQASQEFAEWLLHQPSIQQRSGNMGAQEIMTMMQQHPEVAQEYASQFVREKEQDLLQSYAAHESALLKERNLNAQESLGSTAFISAIHQQNNHVIAGLAAEVNTGSVIDTVTPATQATLQNAQRESQDAVRLPGAQMENEVKRVFKEKGELHVN